MGGDEPARTLIAAALSMGKRGRHRQQARHRPPRPGARGDRPADRRGAPLRGRGRRRDPGPRAARRATSPANRDRPRSGHRQRHDELHPDARWPTRRPRYADVARRGAGLGLRRGRPDRRRRGRRRGEQARDPCPAGVRARGSIRPRSPRRPTASTAPAGPGSPACQPRDQARRERARPDHPARGDGALDATRTASSRGGPADGAPVSTRRSAARPASGTGSRSTRRRWARRLRRPGSGRRRDLQRRARRPDRDRPGRRVDLGLRDPSRSRPAMRVSATARRSCSTTASGVRYPIDD